MHKITLHSLDSVCTLLAPRVRQCNNSYFCKPRHRAYHKFSCSQEIREKVENGRTNRMRGRESEKE